MRSGISHLPLLLLHLLITSHCYVRYADVSVTAVTAQARSRICLPSDFDQRCRHQLLPFIRLRRGFLHAGSLKLCYISISRDPCASEIFSHGLRPSVLWRPLSNLLCKGKGKGQVLDTALLHDEHMLKSVLQSRKWQLIGMS